MSREESGERQAREFEASERTRLGPGAGRTAFGNQALARSGLDLGNTHREGQGGGGGIGAAKRWEASFGREQKQRKVLGLHSKARESGALGTHDTRKRER